MELELKKAVCIITGNVVSDVKTFPAYNECEAFLEAVKFEANPKINLPENLLQFYEKRGYPQIRQLCNDYKDWVADVVARKEFLRGSGEHLLRLAAVYSVPERLGA